MATAASLTYRFRSFYYKRNLILSNFIPMCAYDLRPLTHIPSVNVLQQVSICNKSSLLQMENPFEDRKQLISTTCTENSRWDLVKKGLQPFIKQGLAPSLAKRDKYIPLMLFNEIIWPNLLKKIKTMVFMNVLLKRFIDPNFEKKEFLQEARQMVLKVSKLLSLGDVDGLRGLLTDEAISELRPNLILMTPQQRHSLLIESRNIMLGFIYSLDIKVNTRTGEDNTNWSFFLFTNFFFPQARKVEIVCCFHAYEDPEVPEYVTDLPLRKILQNHDKHVICNYRFVRDYTKGAEGEWMIDRLNHFKVGDIPDQPEKITS